MFTSNLVARCKTRFKDTTSRIITDAEWLAYLNEAYEEVISAHPDWPWLHKIQQETVSAGTSEIDLAYGTTRILSVFNRTDEIRMYPFPDTIGTHHDHYANDATGAPDAYRFLQGANSSDQHDPRLVIYPTPTRSTVIDIEAYVDTPAQLSTAPLDVEPFFPVAHHTMLVHGALAKAYEDDDEFDRSDRHRARFLQMLATLQTLAGLPSTEGYPGIRDTF